MIVICVHCSVLSSAEAFKAQGTVFVSTIQCKVSIITTVIDLSRLFSLTVYSCLLSISVE